MGAEHDACERQAEKYCQAELNDDVLVGNLKKKIKTGVVIEISIFFLLLLLIFNSFVNCVNKINGKW